LQVLGTPPSDINNLDLGFVRINIKMEGGKPQIEYVHDEDANVGSREQTVGMGEGQIPVEAWKEAKAQGQSYDDFIANYKGDLVGQESGQPIESESLETEISSEAENGLEKEFLPEYSNDEVKVFAINEDYIRNNYADEMIGDRLGVDFTGGGHYYVYWDIIPKDEIWVSKTLQGNDRKAYIVHEYIERNKMAQGMEYSEAHNDFANKIEIETRKNPELLDKILNRILQGDYSDDIDEEPLDEVEEESDIENPYLENPYLEKEPEEEIVINANDFVEGKKKPIVRRRIKKPKNMKDWWESEEYKNPQPIVASNDRYYRGRKLLPPSLGAEL